MSKPNSMAPVILGSVVLFLLFQPRAAAEEEPQPQPQPEPQPQPQPQPNPPEIEIPDGPPPTRPDPPWPEPPLPPITGGKVVTATPGRRYHVVADVKPNPNVGFFSAARGLATSEIFAGRFSDFELGPWRSVERPGVGDVTRVEFDVTCAATYSIPLEQEIPIEGVASAWLVSLEDVTEAKQ